MRRFFSCIPALLFVSACVHQSRLGAFAQDATTTAPATESCTEDGTCTQQTNLYEDVDDMLSIAMHTYGYACLRELVMKYPDNFANIKSILNNQMKPIDATQIVAFANQDENKKEILRLNATKSTKGDISLESSASFHHLWKATGETQEGDLTVAIDTDDQNKYAPIDEKGNPKDLVYGIAVDHRKQRIVVTFRGSEIGQDWIRNFSANYRRVANPHYKNSSKKQPEKIRLHTGVHDYLLEKPWFSDRGIKYDSIKAELYKVLNEYPEYALFVTGHSLGGALSTLFSFYIASEPNIPTPVTLVSFAAFLIGDATWQSAYQGLEKDGIVRHVRVAVNEDFVPTWPISSPNLLHWGKDYKHTGIRLTLPENQEPELLHSYGQNTRPTKDTKGIFDTLNWHTLNMYDFRLHQVEISTSLQARTIEGLYEDPQVLGEFATLE